MLALAGETISRRVSRLPFERNGVMVTDELIGITLECLNAEFKKALPLTTVLTYGFPSLGTGAMFGMLLLYFMKFSTDVLLIVNGPVYRLALLLDGEGSVPLSV